MLKIEPYFIGNLKEIVDNLPSEVKSAKIVLSDDNEFSVSWDDNEGHIITWKEPRK